MTSFQTKRNETESRRKRSYAQLATYENGAPSPFPSDGAPKSSSRALSNSSLTVHKDGAYMQVHPRINNTLAAGRAYVFICWW